MVAVAVTVLAILLKIVADAGSYIRHDSALSSLQLPLQLHWSIRIQGRPHRKGCAWELDDAINLRI